jgi:hypothetical protein
MSVYGTKRTSACALHVSAFDPKRTLGLISMCGPSSLARRGSGLCRAQNPQTKAATVARQLQAAKSYRLRRLKRNQDFLKDKSRAAQSL